MFVFTLFITLLGFNPSISKADWDDLLLDKIGCLSLSTTMAIEDTSAEVSKLQSFLSAGYFFNGEFRGQPGYFGTETKSAVQMFQQQSGLVSDGVVGRATRAAIRNVTCNRPGTTSPSQLPEGCTSTQGYSPTTGQRCNVSIPIMPVALPPGCTSTSGYSSTTGEPCGVATMPPIVSYPGFFITFSKTSYLPTENVVATLSRADGSSSGYTVDSYVQSDISDRQFFRSVSVGQNTRLTFRMNQLASYKGAGQYTLLLCDGGKVCNGGVNTNSNYFTISSSAYPPGCNSNQGYSSTTGQRCGDGTTTVISPVLISQNISVVSGDTSDTAQGSFKFTVYSPSSDIQIYRTIPERSVHVVFAGTGTSNSNAGDPESAILTATSGSTGSDSSQYYTVKEGETRTFELSFVISPKSGSGLYRAKASSLYTFAKGTEINFGSEFSTLNVYLRSNAIVALPDLVLKNVIKGDFSPYGFYLNLCMNGSKSINDLKKTNPSLRSFPIEISVYDSNGNQYKTDASGGGGIEDLKNGQCMGGTAANGLGLGVTLQSNQYSAYNQTKKTSFTLDPDNLIKETNENNNGFDLIERVIPPSTPSIISLGASNALPGERVAMFISNIPSASSYFVVFAGQIVGDVNATRSSDRNYLGFTVPATNFPPGSYELTAGGRNYDGSLVFRTQNSIPFTIGTPSSQPSISILRPNGGEKLTQGENLHIAWTTQSTLSTVHIFLVSANSTGGGSGSLGAIGQVSSASSQASPYPRFDWDGKTVCTSMVGGVCTVTPTTVAAGNYKIYIVGDLVSGGTVEDTSNSYFTITSFVDTARRDTIISYYKKYLARTYDQEGLDFWMNSSKTLDQIREGFFDSVEYKTRREDIRQLYLSLLKREPDSAGWDYWANNGLTLGDIKSGVYASYEYTTKQSIAQLYRDLLGREPDDAGLNYWFDQMSTYGKTIKQIEEGIKSSQEYLNRNSTSSSLGASVIYALPMGCSGTQGYSAATGKSCNSR